MNRYRDSLSPQETLRIMEYDIEVRPKCVVCGNNVRYVGKPDSNGLFKQFCSKSCANKYNYEKAKKTKIEKYGSSNNEQKRKQTCLEKYGDKNYNNHEQTVRTNIERYGGVAPACNEEIQKYRFFLAFSSREPLREHLRRYIVKEEMKLMQRKNKQHLKDMEMRIIEILIK